MDFNEMNRKLGDATSREQRIRELAESLERRGLAMTKASARQLAESMVETEMRVQQVYQKRKGDATQYNDPRSGETKPASKPVGFAGGAGRTLGELKREYNGAKEANGEEMRRRAATPAPVSVRTEYERPSAPTTAAPRSEEARLPAQNAVTPAEPSPESASETEEAAPEVETYDTTPEPSELDPDMSITEAAGIAPQEHEESPGRGGEDASALGEQCEQEPAAPSEEYPTLAPAEEHEAEPGDEAVSGDEVEMAPASQEPPEEASVDGVVREAAPEGVPDAVEPGAAPEKAILAEQTEEAAPAAPDTVPEGVAEEQQERETGAAEVSEEHDGQEAASSSDEAPEAESAEEAPPKEDLAKKHGIDLTSMFNVNK